MGKYGTVGWLVLCGVTFKFTNCFHFRIPSFKFQQPTPKHKRLGDSIERTAWKIRCVLFLFVMLIDVCKPQIIDLLKPTHKTGQHQTHKHLIDKDKEHINN